MPSPARPLRPAPPRLFQSAGFRFALLFVGIFSVAAGSLVAVLWWATAGALDRQTVAAIRADTLALVDRHRDAGVQGLVEAIDDRMALDANAETIYLLTDPAGRKLAGNLGEWPSGVGTDSAWFRTAIQHDGAMAEARLHRRDLVSADGPLRLLVGRDESERVQLRLLLTEGVAWSVGAIFVFAIIGAALIRRALQNRMRPAVQTALTIAGGDLSHRVPISAQGDEFDRLGASMNTMLDRIGTLMAGVRGVSDAIAHDLRTPIARARGKLEESLLTAEGEDALRAAVEEGIADLDNISRIFQALLRIAEAEAGARRAFAPLDLPEVLRDAAEFYEAMAEAREQRLDTDLPARLEMVGDRDLLLQAVANLLDNAIKFTPPGGTVRLAARATAEAIEITVSDTGPGLAPEDRAQAAERFFRADASRNTPGSGLGLALVRAVALLHGGDVALGDAHPGAIPPGLRATIRLPAP